MKQTVVSVQKPCFYIDQGSSAHYLSSVCPVVAYQRLFCVLKSRVICNLIFGHLSRSQTTFRPRNTTCKTRSRCMHNNVKRGFFSNTSFLNNELQPNLKNNFSYPYPCLNYCSIFRCPEHDKLTHNPKSGMPRSFLRFLYQNRK